MRTGGRIVRVVAGTARTVMVNWASRRRGLRVPSEGTTRTDGGTVRTVAWSG